MNKKIGVYVLFFSIFLTAQVGRLDFAKKYQEWRLGNPNSITYEEFEALVHDAQESETGLNNLMQVINISDFNVDKVFTYTALSGISMVSTPLILAIVGKLPIIVDRLLARGANLHLQSGWRTPFELVLLAKDDVTKRVVQKTRGIKGTMSQNAIMYFTTSLTDAERAEIDRLAPHVLATKIKEYLPVMDVLEHYAHDRKDAQIMEAIAGYKRKFETILGDVKMAYSAGSTNFRHPPYANSLSSTTYQERIENIPII